jgi:hypothetical protein
VRTERTLEPRRRASIVIDEAWLLDLLMLPEGYRIAAMTVDEVRSSLAVTVESDELPEVPPDSQPPIARLQFHAQTLDAEDGGPNWFRELHATVEVAQ